MHTVQREKTCNTIVGDDGPCFFGLITSKTMEEIQIPPQFMKHLSNEMGDRATLKGPSHHVWTVVVQEKNNGTYLQDGWQEFMRYHSLGNNEFLLFRHDGNSHFTVRIYDQSGLKRRSEIVTCKDQEASKMEAESSTRRRKRGRPRKDNVLHQSKSCKDGEDGAGRISPCHILGRVKKFKKKEHTTTKIQKEAMEPTNVIADPLLKVNEGEKENRGRKKGKGKAQEKHHSENIKYAKRKIKEEEMEPIPTDGERGRVLEKEDLFTSNFPCYKCHLKQSDVQTMFLLPIKRTFSEVHFPQVRTHIVLRNSKGKGWVVTVIPVGGRHSFSGGWRSFVIDNGLKKGDVCIFELVKRSEMQVFVFRAGKRLRLLSEE